MRRFIQSRFARRESVHDYIGVLVPLEEAHLHSYSARCGKAEFEHRQRDDGDAEDDNAADLEDEETALGTAFKSSDNEGEGMLQMDAAEYTVEGLRRDARRGEPGRRWTEYELKSKIINKAIQDIGMGRYNWQLFVLCGFGWFADNLWMQGVSLTLPSLSGEFGVTEKHVRYTTSSLYVGLSIGSALWGLGADIMGRRIAFNLTLLITSIFGTLAALAPNWPFVCILFALMGTGVGGNLPVDGALFLEFLPDASSSLLTLLSVWWPVGQLVSSLFAWYFITNWPVDQGWRLFIATVGLVTFVMFLIRFGLFHLFESPKYLLSQGRQAEAVAVVHGIAFRNGKKTWLTEEILDGVADAEDVQSGVPIRVSASSLLKQNLSSFSLSHIQPLFQNRKLGLTTALIWFCWAAIGMGYPLFNAFLPQYLSHGGAEVSSSVATRSESSAATAETYRNYAIISVVGVPGSLLAAYLVDHDSRFLGRKGTLAISTFVSAVFLFLFVTLGTTPNSQLFFTSVEAFCQNIMYGVLYAFTPEIFPAPVRGAATGVASFLNRVAGLLAPLLAANAPGDGTTTPIYLSAALILAAFVGMVLIPIETRGRQRL
ncbi:sugar transporter [Xylaria bambusicola]|uniref:sugar transporter n=1 Tax=Xylaria bambusicola TaxID=326684 RepID=UPI002007AF39|nr:sugar transporter [Xylaria bambusicola]KAI0509443.1 sugar transporter [Xylaria bambusicola]